MKNITQASVHVVLQGKGGVGKSFISAILAQYFRTKSAPVHCLDTDPVNATFAQYRSLEAEHLKVLRRGTVNEKQFDVLVERVCQGDGVFIVDTGATTFVPLWNYILENEILAFFRAHGRNVFAHSVVTGGQAMSDTLNGLERLAQSTSEKNVVVWLNEYFGEGHEWKDVTVHDLFGRCCHAISPGKFLRFFPCWVTMLVRLLRGWDRIPARIGKPGIPSRFGKGDSVWRSGSADR